MTETQDSCSYDLIREILNPESQIMLIHAIACLILHHNSDKLEALLCIDRSSSVDQQLPPTSKGWRKKGWESKPLLYDAYRF